MGLLHRCLQEVGFRLVYRVPLWVLLPKPTNADFLVGSDYKPKYGFYKVWLLLQRDGSGPCGATKPVQGLGV